MVVDHPLVARWLGGVLAPLEIGEPADGRYTMTGDPAQLDFDGEPIAEGTRSHALGMLLWHINREAVSRSPDLVRVHAAVAARGDSAVLLPAEMEAGKTTLVAGLVRRGLSYLSDEVAAVEPHSLRVRAYPKALAIDPGSWSVLADLRPTLEEGMEAFLPPQWLVPANDIRAEAVTASATPRLLIAPRYEEGAATRLEPIPRADALLLTAAATFELSEHPRRDLETLAAVLRGCDCYRLVVGDLEAACDAVLGAFDRLEGAS